MKILFIVSICLFAVAALPAQQKIILRVTAKEYPAFVSKNQYKYPVFTKANIYLKSGDVASVRFNYDYISHLLKYIGQKNDTLSIANEKDVKFITVATDTIFIDNKYYEWLAGSATARLVVTHALWISRMETQLQNVRNNSPAYNIETHKSILENTNIQLHPDEVAVFSKETVYYICLLKDGRFVEATKKNFSKFFPDKNIEEHIKANKLDLDKEADVLELFTYANTPGN